MKCDSKNCTGQRDYTVGHPLNIGQVNLCALHYSEIVAVQNTRLRELLDIPQECEECENGTEWPCKVCLEKGDK